MIIKSILKSSILIIIFSLTVKISNAHIKTAATQNLKVFDNSEVIARISSSEINRFSIPNSKIDSYQIAKGEVVITPDIKKGEIYISLIHKNSTKPVNIFISSQTGATFKLLLLPKKITAQQIFLIENKPNMVKSEYQNNDQELISFFKDISTNKTPKGYNSKHHKKTIKFSKLSKKYPILEYLKFTSLITTDAHQGQTYIGKKFKVKNKSKEPIILKESYFYDDGVMAVNLDNSLILPQQEIIMYVISFKL